MNTSTKIQPKSIARILGNKQGNQTSTTPLGDVCPSFKGGELLFVEMSIMPTDDTSSLLPEMLIYDTIELLAINVLLKENAPKPLACSPLITYYEHTEKQEFISKVRFPHNYDYNDLITRDDNGRKQNAEGFVQRLIEDGNFIVENKDLVIEGAMESDYTMLFSEDTVISPELLSNSIYQMILSALNDLDEQEK